MNQTPCIIYSAQRDWKFSAEHTKIAATGYTKFKKTENQELDVVTRLIKLQLLVYSEHWQLPGFFSGTGASK